MIYFLTFGGYAPDCYIQLYTCIESSKVKMFREYCISLKIDFFLANSADPDKMPHYAAFYLGLYCLPKKPFRGFWSKKG